MRAGLRLSSRTSDRPCRSTAMVARHTDRAVVAPAPLLKSRRPVRQRFENQRQAPEVGQLPKKRMFCGNLAVLRFFAAGTRGDPVRFFARRGRLPQGVAFGRRTLGVESAKIAISAQRIRSFPCPSKGNSASLNAVRVSRRYEQRTRPGRRFRGRPAQHRQRRVAVAPSRRAARPDAAAGGDYRSQGRVEHPVRQLVSQRLFGLLPGWEDVNDRLRSDSALALAVGRSDRGGAGPRPRHSTGRAP